MSEAGLSFDNPNICRLAQCVVRFSSNSVLDNLNINFGYTPAITDGHMRCYFVESYCCITNGVSQNHFIVLRYCAMIQLVSVLMLIS
jgi:hypothetical protein